MIGSYVSSFKCKKMFLLLHLISEICSCFLLMAHLLRASSTGTIRFGHSSMFLFVLCQGMGRDRADLSCSCSFCCIFVLIISGCQHKVRVAASVASALLDQNIQPPIHSIAPCTDRCSA